MSDASSIRKISTIAAPGGQAGSYNGNAGPAAGSLPDLGTGTTLATSGSIDQGRAAAFYESAIRFLMNPPGYAYSYTDEYGLSKSRKTGQAYICSGAQWVPVGNVIVNVQLPLTTEDITQPVFVADRPYNIVSVTETHGTASASGTLQVVTAASGTAVSAGTAVLASTISTAGTANTPVAGTLSSTIANTQLAAGSTLGLVFGGTTTGYATGLVTIVLQPQ